MKISDDPEIARKQLARELANNSIVNKALARYIEQILEAVSEDTIQPLRDRISQQDAELERVRREVEEARRLIRWAHDTIWEINPSNYDHDEVCKLNDASVEVILGLAVELGEKHGKSDEWWEKHRAARKGQGGNEQ